MLWALRAFSLTSPCKSWAHSPSHLFLAAGWLHGAHPHKLHSTGTTQPPLPLPAAEAALEMMGVSLCTQRKCSVATSYLIQLVWGSLSLALLVSPCDVWRSTEKFGHLAGSGATEHSGSRRKLELCIQQARKISFITLSFPTNSRGISDTAVANWRAHTEIKGFPVVPGSPADHSPQVRPELCAVNCVTPVNLLNQGQRNVCTILASVKPTKSKAICH